MSDKYLKGFDAWNVRKKIIDQPETTSDKDKVPQFSEREVWWCALGVNVGFEQDGKGEQFTRPVLILRKFGKAMFFGVPLTSQPRDDIFHFNIGEIEDGVVPRASLTQSRMLSANRLVSRIGRIGKTKLAELNQRTAELLLRTKSYPHGKPAGVAHAEPKLNSDLYGNYTKPQLQSQAPKEDEIVDTK